MNTILSNWNFMRWLRLALGVAIIVQGALIGEWPTILLGVLFSLLPVFNIGCCGGAGCAVPNAKKNSSTNEVTYEEVR